MLRMLQVDELRKAMGFPQSHTFVHGTRRDRIKLLGNGVAPPRNESDRRNVGTSVETNQVVVFVKQLSSDRQISALPIWGREVRLPALIGDQDSSFRL